MLLAGFQRPSGNWRFREPITTYDGLRFSMESQFYVYRISLGWFVKHERASRQDIRKRFAATLPITGEVSSESNLNLRV